MRRQIKQDQPVSLSHLDDPRAAICCAAVENEKGWTIIAVSLSPVFKRRVMREKGTAGEWFSRNILHAIPHCARKVGAGIVASPASSNSITCWFNPSLDASMSTGRSSVHVPK
jgi:hypothetical protein